MQHASQQQLARDTLSWLGESLKNKCSDAFLVHYYVKQGEINIDEKHSHRAPVDNWSVNLDTVLYS